VTSRALPVPRTTVADERAAAERAIDAQDLPPARKREAKHQLRAAIRIYPKPVDDLPVGTSRFGGLPDLSPGLAWPRVADRYPMTFVAQFRLDELGAYDVDRRLPERGLLAFFVHVDGPLPYSQHRVLYIPDAAKLARAAPERASLVTAALRFHTTFELPAPYTGHEIIVDPGVIPRKAPPPRSQLLGYDHHRGSDPLPARTSPVFRYDSDNKDVAFRIADDDLRTRRFDRTEIWLQAG
jgi:uncharacterized protein DUF1963